MYHLTQNSHQHIKKLLVLKKRKKKKTKELEYSQQQVLTLPKCPSIVGWINCDRLTQWHTNRNEQSIATWNSSANSHNVKRSQTQEYILLDFNYEKYKNRQT